MSDTPLPMPPAQLRIMLTTLHWMARRYADGRSTYATSLLNRITKQLLAAGVPLNPTGDNRVFADDAMGHAYDGLTPEDLAAEQAYCARWRRGRPPHGVEDADA